MHVCDFYCHLGKHCPGGDKSWGCCSPALCSLITVNVQKVTWYWWIRVNSDSDWLCCTTVRTSGLLHETASGGVVWCEWMNLTQRWCDCAMMSQWTDSPVGLRIGTQWEWRCHRTDIYVFHRVRAPPTHARANVSIDFFLCKVMRRFLCVCRGLLVNQVCPSLDQEDLL